MALENIAVYLHKVSDPKHTITALMADSTGFYMFKNLLPGKYQTTFYATGLYVYCINIEVMPNFTTFIDKVQLAPTITHDIKLPHISEGIYIRGCNDDAEEIARILSYRRK